MKSTIILLFFSLSQFYLQAQEKSIDYGTKITYKFTFQNDSTSEGSRKSIFTQLLIGENESHFQTESKFKSDSALSVGATNRSIFYRYGRINPNSFLIVKKDGSIYTYEPVSGVGFAGNKEQSYYEQKTESLKWEIHSDTMMYHKTYVSQRATLNWGGRKWTAWFTMDIPISDGPYKFSGLPGLILSISDENKFFNFELVSIEKVQRKSLSFDKVRPDLSLLKTTADDFYKERKKFRANMIEFGMLQGTKFSEEAKRSINLEIKTDNNFIERY